MSKVLLYTLAAICGLFTAVNSAFSQGTTFTYQGRLNDGGNAATGSYDLTFSLWTNSSGAAQVGGTLTNAATGVTNGLFTVTLDFGANFPGADRWLEIGVRTNGGGAFATLNPRQKITATPYAITAGNMTGSVSASQLSGTVGSANVSGTYDNAVTFSNAANQFTGTFTGNGGGLTNVNAATLGGLGSSGFWQTAGNAGTSAGTNFVGTTDNQPLELKVNGQRAFRVEPTAGVPNVIGGSPSNSVAGGMVGATIAGGGSTNTFGFLRPNSVQATFGMIGGGYFNTIQSGASNSVIDGGNGNTIQAGAEISVIGGGGNNTIQSNATGSTIAGGGSHSIQTNADFSTIGGGQQHTIEANANNSTIAGGNFITIQSTSHSSTIGGGANHVIRSNSPNSTIAGGRDNVIQTNSATGTIGGGDDNEIQSGVFNATIAGGQSNVIQTGAYRTSIGGGQGNKIENISFQSTIAGGFLNTIRTNSASSFIGGGMTNIIETNSAFSVIAGGQANTILGDTSACAIGGGSLNTNGGFASVIGGGHSNRATGNQATVPGGQMNIAAGSTSFAAGQQAQALHSGAFVWNDASAATSTASTAANQFVVRAAGGVTFWSDFAASVGVNLAPGANAFSPASDRNVKENFKPVDARAMLEKVASLPITEWNLKTQEPGIRHMGPMAQDFKAAFGLGEDDRHISTTDADGVALAAIQGLNEKLKDKEARIAELEERLSRLEKIVSNADKK